MLSLSQFYLWLLLGILHLKRGLWTCKFFPHASKLSFELNDLKVQTKQSFFMKTETSEVISLFFSSFSLLPESIVKMYSITLTCKSELPFFKILEHLGKRNFSHFLNYYFVVFSILFTCS